jgi:ankyrin repeat protein
LFKQLNNKLLLLQVASVLLEHGAAVTATTQKGFTPLHLASKYGNLKVAKLLIQKDAPVDAEGKVTAETLETCKWLSNLFCFISINCGKLLEVLYHSSQEGSGEKYNKFVQFLRTNFLNSHPLFYSFIIVIIYFDNCLQ